jgi:hypothetical protein
MPRYLQNIIHSNYSTSVDTWTGYRAQITGLWPNYSNKSEINNHLIRDYNRKIDILNIDTGNYISPYDAGYRYIGGTGSLV